MSIVTPEPCLFKFQAQELPEKLRQISQQLPTGYWLFEFPDLPEATRENTWYFALSRSQVVFSGDQQISWQQFLKCFQRYVPRFRSESVKAAILHLENQFSSGGQDNESKLLCNRLNKLYELNLISPNEVREALRLNILSDCDTYLFNYAGQAHCLPLPEAEISSLLVGFDLEDLMTKAKERQVWWLKLQSLIPSMESVPVLNETAITAGNLTPEQKQWLKTLVSNGKTLNDIAIGLGQDPLETAKLFARLVHERLVTLISSENKAGHEIFVVDDSQILLKQFENLVTSWGYRVCTFDDPQIALQKIPSSNPAVIFLDINMPHINGFDLIMHIRRQSNLSTVPLVMLTAEKTLSNNWRSRLSGCRFLSKPLSSDEIPKFHLELRELLTEVMPIYQQPAYQGRSIDPLVNSAM